MVVNGNLEGVAVLDGVYPLTPSKISGIQKELRGPPEEWREGK